MTRVLVNKNYNLIFNFKSYYLILTKFYTYEYLNNQTTGLVNICLQVFYICQNLHMEDLIVIPVNPTWWKYADVFSEFQDHQDVQDPGTVKLGVLPAINPLTSTVSANIPDWIWLPTPLVFLHRQFLTFQDLQLSSMTNWWHSLRK